MIGKLGRRSSAAFTGDLDALKAELEGLLLRERLVVECDVELLPPGTLPRFEMKAQPIRKLYEEPLFRGAIRS
jgi:phenylacetate-CoA ligase